MKTCRVNPRSTSASPGRRPRVRTISMRRLTLVAILVGGTAGCLAVPPVLLTDRMLSEKEPSGDVLKQLQQESAPYLGKGTAAITGTIAMQYGGETFPAAVGTPVYLTPVTTYATVRMQKYAIEDNTVPDRPHSQVAWLVRTSEGGAFRFRDLPAGSYYVVSQMFWSPPSDPGGQRGDVTYATVRVAAGESVNVLVTRPSPAAN